MAAWPLSHRVYLLATVVAGWLVLADLSQPCRQNWFEHCHDFARGDLAVPVAAAWLLASVALRRPLRAQARLLRGR